MDRDGSGAASESAHGASFVSCLSCGHRNPAGNRFCGQCGAALDVAPPPSLPALDTSFVIAPGPVDLGSVISGAVGAVLRDANKERRPASILFADLVGSTQLGEQLDPERVDEIIGDAMHVLAAAVQKFGGYVAKQLGDGLLALFGVPLAFEDHAERAVLAGLEAQRMLAATNTGDLAGQPLRLRVGITSGEVIVTEINGVYDVIGDVPNVAARLQAHAPVGSVLAAEDTVRQARRAVLFGPASEFHVKGRVQPVVAYPAVGVRETPVERWELGSGRTSFIGRNREIDAILEAWSAVGVDGGQLVQIVGEAGAGKSRLLLEAVERISRESHARVLRRRCPSYGQTTNLWFVADLVRVLAGLSDAASAARVRARLGVLVRDALPEADTATRAEAREALADLVGVTVGRTPLRDPGSRTRRAILVDALSAMMMHLAKRGPALVVLDDLHWLDPGSAEVLADVLTIVPTSSLLVLAAQRPEWEAPWRQWEWVRHVELSPLTAEDAVSLARNILAAGMLDRDLERELAERASGNPFFLEECLRALGETGGLVRRGNTVSLVEGAADSLPGTLTELLLARLDRLDGKVRGVVQVASVLGRSFSTRVLARVLGEEAAVVEELLAEVSRTELAFPARDVSEGDPSYIFKHPAIRDVAYNTLLQRRRRKLHAAAARAIATLYQPDEYVDVIAYHFARSDEHDEAAHWLERAADRAVALDVPESAVDLYARALDQLQSAERQHETYVRIEGKLSRLSALSA